MNVKSVRLKHVDDFSSLHDDIRNLNINDRDKIIISTTVVDGVGVVTSRYGDEQWYINGIPSNKPAAFRKIDFLTMPESFRKVLKEIIFRYMRRGRAGLPRPKGGSVKNLFERSRRFINHLNSLGITSLTEISPLVIHNYVAKSRDHKTWRGKKLSPGSLIQVFIAVEAVYELSQFSSEPMPLHPWPDTSASAMTGFVGNGSRHRVGGTTPLIPDDIFCRIFERAHKILEGGNKLLDVRDAGHIEGRESDLSLMTRWKAKGRRLSAAGWDSTQSDLNRRLIDLRTACYIVLASTSGCRNHELANLFSGAHHRTVDEGGNIYHWMRSKSEKTNAGVIDWMIPDVAVRALRIMERWAAPYQALVNAEVVDRKRNDPLDPEITEAGKHRHALFLGKTNSKGNQTRTLSLRTWSVQLSKFAKETGVDWNLTSHQFRRKFANYVAHSKFGDLRYLRDHFAHWSMDMTLGYAMDQNWGAHLDIDLFEEIRSELEDTKAETVESWFNQDILGGGYGRSIKQWQRNPENLAIFKSPQAMIMSIAESTSIRSNGHAWCTADNDGCVGNTLERTRCGGCNNAVISLEQAPIYEKLYNELNELRNCQDIGEGGRARISRDLDRCLQVFKQLNHDLDDKLE